MKKLIQFALLFVCGMSFAQIKVLPTTPLERLGRVGTNDVYVQKEGNEFTFFYKDLENKENPSIKHFSFKNVDNDYEGFFKIIMDGFAANPMNDIKLELPNDYVWLHYTKSTGKVTVQFMTTNKITTATGISEMLTPDDIKKLFERS